MKVNFKAIGFCLAIVLSFTPGGSADDTYIIGKEEDETLLTLSIAFVAVCGLFFLVSVVMSLVMIRRSRVAGGVSQYQLEDREDRYESMYSSKQNGENMSPSHYEQLKLNEPSNGVYQSIDKPTGQQNNNMSKQSTPPTKEKDQKDTKDTDKKNKTLSSFQNPAYQSTSMHSGLDLEYEAIPASDAPNKDTAL